MLLMKNRDHRPPELARSTSWHSSPNDDDCISHTTPDDLDRTAPYEETKSSFKTPDNQDHTDQYDENSFVEESFSPLFSEAQKEVEETQQQPDSRIPDLPPFLLNDGRMYVVEMPPLNLAELIGEDVFPPETIEIRTQKGSAGDEYLQLLADRELFKECFLFKPGDAPDIFK